MTPTQEAELREKVRVLELAKMWASAARLRSKLEAVELRFVTVELLTRRKSLMVVDVAGAVWTITPNPIQARTDCGRRHIFADIPSLKKFMKTDAVA
jgi:hypothetical protein